MRRGRRVLGSCHAKDYLRVGFGGGVFEFAQVAPVAERVAKQNALFEEFYETGLKNSPERATAFGDYRYNSFSDNIRWRKSPASMRSPMIF